MARLRSRQRVAWERIAGQIDDFVRELHEGTENLVVVGSDHGECFGEMGWAYHFANVTDGGTRVPLFWLEPGRAPATLDTPVSARDLFGAILSAVGEDVPPGLRGAPEESLVVMESAWYDAQGRTLPRFKYNQLCFVSGEMRWLRRDGRWYGAPPSALGRDEPAFVPLPVGVDPVEELAATAVERTRLRRIVTDFEAYSTRIS
jgi:arylsulfatase A-like enzyme